MSAVSLLLSSVAVSNVLTDSFPAAPTKTPSANPTVPTNAPTAEWTVFVGQSPVNWENAEAYCVGLSGHLLSIHSNDTQTTAAQLCETRVHIVNNSGISYGCFIGLYFNDSAAADESVWSWTDGTAIDYGFNATSKPQTGYPWYPGEPNNLFGNEKYVHLQRGLGWTWNDLHQYGEAYPICKGPETPYPSTEPTFDPTAYPTYDISNSSYCNFSVGNTNLSRSTYKGAVGYSRTENSIVILGGISPGENMQALSFSLDDSGTTDYGLNELNIALNGLSGYYTQIKHTLYVLDGSATIYAFDLETVDLISNVVVTTLDSSRSWSAVSSCLTADSNRGYIFMIDGGNSMLNTISISDGQSIGISDTNFSRPNLVCIYDDQTDTLYAIGGEGYKSVLTMEVTPFLETAENGTPEPVWSQMPDGLPDAFCCGQAFLYRDDILLIGSKDADLSDVMSFYIIERFGDHAIYSANYGLSLVTPRIGASAIIVDDILYLFSGTSAQRSSLTSWEYVDLTTICLDTTATPTMYLTNNPTADITVPPTANPMVQPSEHPTPIPIINFTLNPTADPTLDPTIDSTMNTTTITSTTAQFMPRSAGNDLEHFILIIVVVSAVLFNIICIAGVSHCISQFKMRRKINKAMKIKNGLIVSMAIGDYGSRPHGVRNSDKLIDLPVGTDVQNLRKFADFLHFTFMTVDNKLSWTKDEVIRYLTHDVMGQFLDENGVALFDGLIVSISCHGVGNSIISSDYKSISRTDIHRCISDHFPQIRDIPRIFLFDACDGQRDREEEVTPADEDDNRAKDGAPDLLRVHTAEWTGKNKNPDYNMVVVHGSNEGYVSKMLVNEKGSYLTYGFTQAVMRNIERKQRKGLAVLLKEVQNDLHDKGKQLIRKEFFNNTEDLMIEINTQERATLRLATVSSFSTSK